MKTVSISDLRRNFSRAIRKAQAEPIGITRYGKIVALLIGIEGVGTSDAEIRAVIEAKIPSFATTDVP